MVPMHVFLLSFSDSKDGPGKDELFKVASDIINRHNQVIENLYSSNQAYPTARRFPEPPLIHPTEVHANMVIFGDFQRSVYINQKQCQIIEKNSFFFFIVYIF